MVVAVCVAPVIEHLLAVGEARLADQLVRAQPVGLLTGPWRLTRYGRSQLHQVARTELSVAVPPRQRVRFLQRLLAMYSTHLLRLVAWPAVASP